MKISFPLQIEIKQKTYKMTEIVLIANCLFIPSKIKFHIYIKKDGKIGIGRYKKSIEEWEEFFKEKKPFEYHPDLSPEDYDIVEQDFKAAVKIYESWRS